MGKAVARKPYRRYEPREEQRPERPGPGGLYPSQHRCSPWDINYGAVVTECTVCGRQWKYLPASEGKPARIWCRPITKVMP